MNMIVRFIKRLHINVFVLMIAGAIMLAFKTVNLVNTGGKLANTDAS